MAKRKPSGSKGEGWKSKPLIVQMRGTPEFKAFVEEAAKFDRSPVAAFVERAIVHYSRVIGFKKEPPER